MGINVLAVDDDIINLKLISAMLKKDPKIGTIVTASNGADAIEELKRNPDIQIVLLDIIMPIMGGIETLQVIRADAQFQNLPIIVLTTDETKKVILLSLGQMTLFLNQSIVVNFHKRYNV